jgi:hypothetical protein
MSVGDGLHLPRSSGPWTLAANGALISSTEPTTRRTQSAVSAPSIPAPDPPASWGPYPSHGIGSLKLVPLGFNERL